MFGWRGAIIKCFSDDPRGILLKNAIADGQLYFGEIPDNPVPSMPYISFDDMGEDPQYHGAGIKEIHSVNFIFFATTLESAEAIERLLKLTYDGAVLVLSNGQKSGGGQFVSGGKIEKVRKPLRDKQGNWIYKGEFPYKTIVNR